MGGQGLGTPGTPLQAWGYSSPRNPAGGQSASARTGIKLLLRGQEDLPLRHPPPPGSLLRPAPSASAAATGIAARLCSWPPPAQPPGKRQRNFALLGSSWRGGPCRLEQESPTLTQGRAGDPYPESARVPPRPGGSEPLRPSSTARAAPFGQARDVRRREPRGAQRHSWRENKPFRKAEKPQVGGLANCLWPKWCLQPPSAAHLPLCQGCASC